MGRAGVWYLPNDVLGIRVVGTGGGFTMPGELFFAALLLRGSTGDGWRDFPDSLCGGWDGVF